MRALRTSHSHAKLVPAATPCRTDARQQPCRPLCFADIPGLANRNKLEDLSPLISIWQFDFKPVMMTAPRSFVTIGFSVKLPVRTIRTIVYSVLSVCVCSGWLGVWPGAWT